MKHIITLPGNSTIKGEDLNELLKEADQKLYDFKMTYVNRAYGHGGWV